jgi:hypothetical protein
MKKTKKKKIFIVIIGIISFISVLFLIKPSLARYIYNGIKNYYYESKRFYFNCDKLSDNHAFFQLDNWDGVNSFSVTYNLDSFKNNFIAAESDISYDITYSCSNNVTCTINKQNGIIYSSTHTDYFIITITPITPLSEGDSVTLDVSVSSTSPYTKTLSGEVKLNVSIPGISYEIEDKANRPYLDFNITNTLNYYQVVTAFGSYHVGDVLEAEVYNNLSATDKEKCTSALIKLTFDPNVILIDITSDFYENAYNYTTEVINNKEYVNSITFGVDPITSISIRFYKVEASNNYTYPFVNPSSIINFEVL